MLKACREHGLHTTVETAGNIPWENLAKAVPYTDLFLFDVKHTDPAKLATHTGVDASLNQRNLDNLSRGAKHLIVRTPVVSEFNDTEAEIRSIARLVRHLGIPELHLLLYHRYGQGKFRLLGRTCIFAGPADLAPGVLECLQHVATAEVLRVQVGANPSFGKGPGFFSRLRFAVDRYRALKEMSRPPISEFRAPETPVKILPVCAQSSSETRL